MTLSLEDRALIGDLVVGYAFAIDERNWQAFEALFTPDAHIDYTAAGGIKGTLPEVRDWLAGVMAGFPMTQHLVTNKVVAIDGDRATCQSALLNPMGVPDGDGMMLWLEGGTYRDRLVRTAAGWRIAERIEQPTFSTRRHRLIARTLAL